MKILSIKVQGTGQPGGRYWVENFHIKVVTPSGDIVPFQNNKSFQGNIRSVKLNLASHKA